MLNKTQPLEKLKSKERSGGISIKNMLKEPYDTEKFVNGELTSDGEDEEEEMDINLLMTEQDGTTLTSVKMTIDDYISNVISI